MRRATPLKALRRSAREPALGTPFSQFDRPEAASERQACSNTQGCCTWLACAKLLIRQGSEGIYMPKTDRACRRRRRRRLRRLNQSRPLLSPQRPEQEYVVTRALGALALSPSLPLRQCNQRSGGGRHNFGVGVALHDLLAHGALVCRLEPVRSGGVVAAHLHDRAPAPEATNHGLRSATIRISESKKAVCQSLHHKQRMRRLLQALRLEQCLV